MTHLIARAWILAFVLPSVVPAQEGDPFLGRWAGTYRTESAEQGPFRIDVIPRGGAAYLLAVRMGERGSRYEVAGTREGDTLRFRGRFQAGSGTDEAAYDLGGTIVRRRLTGTFSSPEASGTIELALVPVAALPGEAVPPGAAVLFDGAMLDRWQRADGKPADWLVRNDGSLEAGTADLVSREDFGDFRLQLEFLLPLEPAARGGRRAGGGLVLGGDCEIRLADSFGLDPTKESCGAIASGTAPRADACRPPLEWQTLDVVLRAPGELTVTLNGVVLHERHRFDGHRRGPLRLRAGGSPVRFRNIWLQPLGP